jgi:AraC family transcriptional regulator of adaptative response / DNA-3-methyladenine glycosylase II
MRLDPESCHRALDTHDPRFDGLFFVGISSTGIYCRPVCPTRQTKRENRTFYPTAAAAEAAGYRPCLRCRPELAPGRSSVDAVNAWARAAVRRIEDGALGEMSLEELASELGISARHLRRVVQSEYGVSPVELAQTQKLLTAKGLLTDTDLPIGEVAMASGFASVRRFNALFGERYGLTPSKLRKKGGATGRDSIMCSVSYRPPLDWCGLIDFIAYRAACGVEAIDGTAYLRTVSIKGRSGWIRVTPELGVRSAELGTRNSELREGRSEIGISESPSHKRHSLKVEVSNSLAPVLPEVLVRVRRLFDLAAEPCAIAEALGELVLNPGIRVPGAFDGFEIAVRAILGQQVSVQAASVIAGRFSQAFGEPIDTPYPQLNRLTPSPAKIAALDPSDIAATGIIASRARAIVSLAQAIVDKEIVLRPGSDVAATMARLCKVPGIGPWTAEYVAMRSLSWPDAFPASDLGIRKALALRPVIEDRGDRPHPPLGTSPGAGEDSGLPSEKEVLARAEAWRPWRSYAAMHLWRTL